MDHLDGKLITDEMSLATLLFLHGYDLRMEKAKGTRVVWVLDEEEVDEYAVELVSDFRSGEARVEPSRFASELGRVRKRLYSFIGHRGVPVGS